MINCKLFEKDLQFLILSECDACHSKDNVSYTWFEVACLECLVVECMCCGSVQFVDIDLLHCKLEYRIAKRSCLN
jgi:hypothetical protein